MCRGSKWETRWLGWQITVTETETYEQKLEMKTGGGASAGAFTI